MSHIESTMSFCRSISPSRDVFVWGWFTSVCASARACMYVKLCMYESLLVSVYVCLCVGVCACAAACLYVCDQLVRWAVSGDFTQQYLWCFHLSHGWSNSLLMVCRHDKTWAFMAEGRNNEVEQQPEPKPLTTTRTPPPPLKVEGISLGVNKNAMKTYKLTYTHFHQNDTHAGVIE